MIFDLTDKLGQTVVSGKFKYLWTRKYFDLVPTFNLYCEIMTDLTLTDNEAWTGGSSPSTPHAWSGDDSDGPYEVELTVSMLNNINDALAAFGFIDFWVLADTYSSCPSGSAKSGGGSLTNVTLELTFA
jgi:hypothetical protein